VVLFARQGQNRLFLFHFLLADCGEDGSGATWWSTVRRRVQGSSVMEGPFRGHGERGWVGPKQPLPCLLSPLPLLPLTTLASQT
jgi:hypothetical protein